MALQWAEANDAEIVSCDSLLFYRGMNLGTAKPTPAELARVPHHLIDICAVDEPMDIARFVVEARRVVEDIFTRGRAVLVTGGSGFYLKAFLAPVADDVGVPPELRERVQATWRNEGLEALLVELRALNPDGLGALDVQNPRRVTRALERCLVSGKTLEELRVAFAAQTSPFADFDVKLCELVREPADLEMRIAQRVQQMLRDGLIDEVRVLLNHGLRGNPSAALAIGYRETIDLIDGKLPETELAAAIARNTRGLVKKQRTWFKMQLPEHRRVAAGSATVASLFK